MKYSEAFKSKMVRKLASPGGPSASALAQDVGVHQSTLSRWLRQAGRVEGMKKRDQPSRSWSAAQKLEAVLEAATLSEEDLGPFLRRKGLYRKDLEQWRGELRRKDAALAETAALLVLKKKAQAIWGAEDDATPRRKGK